jgi:hypothetical protein
MTFLPILFFTFLTALLGCGLAIWSALEEVPPPEPPRSESPRRSSATIPVTV